MLNILSRKIIGFVSCLCLSVAMFTSASFAQSGLEMGKELSNNPLDKKVLNEIDKASDMWKNWTVYTPEPGPLNLMNCSGKTINVATYNSNDTVMLIPYKTYKLPNGKHGRLRCKTAKCKLIIKPGGKTVPMDGYWVLKKGLKRTNARAVLTAADIGCGIYK